MDVLDFNETADGVPYMLRHGRADQRRDDLQERRVHGECPMSYDESLPGTPCHFTPDEGACYWSNSYETCTCRDGKFDCS